MRSFESRKILLVEDEEIIAKVHIPQLEQAGYIVHRVSSGEEAVKYAGRTDRQIDLILMDIDLGPGIKGTVAAEEILKIRDVPVLFLSSHTEAEVINRTEDISSYGYVVKDKDPTVLYASVKMAFKLHDAQGIYESVFEHSMNGLCVYELLHPEDDQKLDAVFLKVNEAFYRHTGRTGQILIGKKLSQLYPDEDMSAILGFYRDVVLSGKPDQKEIYFEPNDKWFEIKAFPLFDRIFTVAIENITERKENEEALIRSEKLYHTLFDDHSAVKLLIESKTGRIADVNKAAEIFYGMDKESLTKQFIQDINQMPREEVESEMEKVKTGQKNYFEFRHLTAGGIKEVFVFSNRVEIDGVDYLHSIVCDVSRLKSG